MKEHHRIRLEEARSRWASIYFLADYSGAITDAILGGLRAWSMSRKPVKQPEQGEKIDRWLFENWLQTSSLMPVRFAAAQLGMTLRSFHEVMEKLDESGRFHNSSYWPELFREEDVRDFHRIFPATEHRVFRDHDNFCIRIHEAIKAELSVDVQPLKCKTSEEMGDTPADFAHDFDIITGDPVGLRYQVWLSTGKPMNLKPDCCSTLFFVDNENELRGLEFAPGQDAAIDRVRAFRKGQAA